MLVEPMEESSTLGKIMTSDFFNSDNDISTEIQLIKNVTNLNSALSKLDLTQYKNSKGFPYSIPSVLGSLKEKISITNYDDTNLVELSVKDENPQFASDFANAIAVNFNEMLSEYSKESKNSQIEFLNKQIPSTENKLDEANDALFNYKAETGIDFLSNNTSSLVNHITYLQLRKKPLELQISESESLIDEFEELFAYQLLDFDDYVNDERVQEILKNYELAFDELILFDMVSNSDYRNTTSLSVVNYNINENLNNRIGELNSQMNQSKKELLNRIKAINLEKNIPQLISSNQYHNMNDYYFAIVDKLCGDVDIINISKNIDNFEKEFNKIPLIEKEMSKLESDVDSLEDIRKELNSLREQLSLTTAAQNNNVKLVSPAVVPINPVSPNKLLILAVSILLGAALGFFMCIVLNLMDDKIHSIDDLKKVIGPNIPILGWIPLIDTKKHKATELFNITLNCPKSYVTERYKAITSNILYGKNRHSKVFTVTSSTINEGKSCLVCNVAMSLSQLGYKVLILDGDIRYPSIGNFFNVDKKKPGYITSLESNLPISSTCIAPIKGNADLQLLLPGHSDLNPSVFYANTNFHESIDDLREIYDYIFIDSPPLEYASELLGLIRQVDSVILCTRMSIVSKSGIAHLLEQLGEQKSKIGGLVASGCPLSNINSYCNYNTYYNDINNYSKKKESNDFVLVKSERKAVKIFKKDIEDRKNKKKIDA
jgi:capsular exopolysaccharide synthesis family protein